MYLASEEFKMNIYYTYAYLRADGTPYYIGKGKAYRAYVKEHGSVYPPKDKSRIVFLHKDVSENHALVYEMFYIGIFGRKDKGTEILRNKTDGGDRGGYIMTDAIRKNMSIAAKKRPNNQLGLVRTQEQLEHASKQQQAIPEEIRKVRSSLGGKCGKDKPKQQLQCSLCNKMVFKHLFDRHTLNNCLKY